MAVEDQLNLIKEGVEVWNDTRWRYPPLIVDLSGANFEGANFEGADFSNADLTNVNLSRANLKNANLSDSNLSGVNLTGANLTNAVLPGANLSSGNLHNTYLSNANLGTADLTNAYLRNAQLDSANLCGVDFTGADLSEAKLSDSDLVNAKFCTSNLNGADLRFTLCIDTQFNNANLHGANFSNGTLKECNFCGANLDNVNFREASLIKMYINEAILTNCKIYGISAWDLIGSPKSQFRLVITPEDEAEITVDDLQLAQFIYLLLSNHNVRNVIDTITSKAVLILGRFTSERKAILDLIREELHKHNYVPILFDFENTENQSLLETVMTLAGMARFIVADVTAATMVREELRSVVEKYPAKPIQPLLLNGEQEYITLPEMRSGFKNILPTFTYIDTNEVVSELPTNVITPAENWLKARKNELLNGDNTDEVIALKKKIEALEKQLQAKHI